MTRFLPLVIVAPILLALSSPGPRAAAQASSPVAPPAHRIVQPIQDDVTTTIAVSRPPQAKVEFDRGAAPANLSMNRILLLLKPSGAQAAGLDEYLQAVLNPASPSYHRWLTPAQFGAAYGADAADVDAVRGWLTQQGFAVGTVAAGRQWIEFTGTVAQVEAAFHTSIHSYLLNGVSHLGNATDLQIPAALAPVVSGVLSLNNFASVSAARTLQTEGPGLSPADFASIYDLAPLFKSGIDGAGQTIALIERSNLRIADVQGFRKKYGFPVNDPVVMLNGTDPGLNADETEALLDASWAGAIAPKAAVRVIASSSTNATDGVDLSIAYAVDHAVASVIETGFVACEANLDAYHRQFYSSVWSQAAAEGITAIVAAGNRGAACDDASSIYGSVNAMASTAFNTAVGGSSFANDASASPGYPPESGWSDSENSMAGGGGVSGIHATPYWQVAADVPAADPAAAGDHHRYLPDLSLNAVGYALCLDSDCARVTASGTSVAAAAFAGVMALVNEYTNSAQGNAAPVLYALARKGVSFHDIAAGNNRLACDAGSAGCDAFGSIGYDASEGYDLATGLGSIDVASFVHNYANAASTGTAAATIALTSSSLTPAYGTTLTATAILQATAAASTTQPSGVVSFTVDSTAAGTAPLTAGAANSTAALPLATPTVGTHTIGASYAGDDTFAAVKAAPVTINVQKGVSVTTMVSNPPSLISGTPETFTATVGSAVTSSTQTLTFTGDIVFYDGTIPLGSPVSLVANTAVLANVTLDPTVAHSVTAQYYGDGNWLGSVSIAQTLAVAAAPTTSVLTTQSSAALAGTSLSFTITVSGTSTLAPTAIPTGAATFYDGMTAIGQATLAASPAASTGVSTATFFTSTLGGGTHSITAHYPGNKNFAASVSNALTVTIGSYSVTSNTTSLALTAGHSGSVVFTVASALTSGISFACQAPPDTDTGCSFAPASVAGNGQTTLTITTAAATTTVSELLIKGAGSLASLVLICVAFGQRANRRLRGLGLLSVALLSTVIVTATGCGSGKHVVVVPGTPSGTQVFTITTSATLGNQTTTQKSYISVDVTQ